MVMDEKLVLAVVTLNFDNKTLHNDLVQNEIVAVVVVVAVVEELIPDLKVFQQCSKNKKCSR